MGTEITDTEVVTAGLKRVTLGGVKFRVPQSPTIAYMFWMRSFLGKFGDQSLTDDDIVDCYDQTVDFLRQFNDKVDEQRLQKHATLVDLISFYNRCYGGDAEDEADERPPQRRRGTAGQSRTARRSRSST